MELKELIAQRQAEAYELHKRHLNPAFVRVLQLIGFDKLYTRGEGPWLYDDRGDRYLDLLSGYGVFALGRSHPAVKRVLHEVLDLDRPNIVQMDGPLLAGLLAEKLTEIAEKSFPNAHLDAVFFTNSGTEAVEGALKFARAATGRPRFLYLEHAFHGLTLGSLSVNGDAHFREGFEPLLPAAAIPLNDLEALERELEKGDVAALIVEPIQGKGVYVPNERFLPEAQRLCREHGTLFILDEVQTGLGRTGRWFAGEHWGLSPDVVTVAKALSGGYVPVGAILTRREIHRRVFSSLERSVVHSNTFGMNELAMAAGLAALHVLDEEGLVERAAALGERFLRGLQELQRKHEFIKEVRGKGLMLGIEFGPPRSLKLKAGWAALERAQPGLFAQLVVMALMRDHKILSQVAGHRVNIVKFLPPLVITEREVDYTLQALDAVLGEAQKFPGGLWAMGAELLKNAFKR